MYRIALLFLWFCAVAHAEPLKPVKEAEVPKELLQARLDAIRKVFEIAKAEYEAGRGPMDDLPVWSNRLLEAERALATTKEEHLASCRQHVERMRNFEKVQKLRFEAGAVSPKEVAASSYFRAEAEIILARVTASK